jgi:Fe-S cluster assembly protein SufD
MTNLSELIAVPAHGRWQQALLDRLARTELPTRKTEQWRYSARHLGLTTPLRAALGRDSDHVAVSTVRIRDRQPVRTGALPAGLSVQIVPGEAEGPVCDTLSSSLNLPFAWMNGAVASAIVVIRVAANTEIASPLLLDIEAATGLSTPRVLLVLEQHASLTLIEQFSVTPEVDSESLCTAVLDIELHDGARLTQIKQSAIETQARQILSTTVRMQRASRLLAYGLHTGSALGRHDFHVHLLGQGAECALNGICLTQEAQHFDIHTSIEHLAPNCQSNQNYRCIADDRSHLVFNGRIHIHRDAQKSSGALSNRNLLLSPEAEIDAKPELEIYADDVKCAHGTTIGKLNPNELYYLQTRGIDQARARQMLTLGFLLEIVRAIPVDAVAEHWTSLLAERLQGHA